MIIIDGTTMYKFMDVNTRKYYDEYILLNFSNKAELNKIVDVIIELIKKSNFIKNSDHQEIREDISDRFPSKGTLLFNISDQSVDFIGSDLKERGTEEFVKKRDIDALQAIEKLICIPLKNINTYAEWDNVDINFNIQEVEEMINRKISFKK